MTKTIKETWKEKVYEIITHNETSGCHLKLVALVESLISEVEALVRNEFLSEVEKEVEKKLEEHDYVGKVAKQEDISTIINQLKVN